MVARVPQRLHRIECLVTPERRLILVLGEGADQASYLPDFREDRSCYADRDVMYLVSVSDYHEAAVALEAWDGPPDPMPDAELAEVAHMELRGGVFVCPRTTKRLTCSRWLPF